MKHLFLLILLSLVPMLSTAQTLTEAQKQEALQAATKFCNLLERFSNGERTLNAQINALCSGADCSAFDDIKTNKEATMRNYLMAIQLKYPGKLAMAVSKPSFSNSQIYCDYDFSVSTNYNSFGGQGQHFMTDIPIIEKDNLLNVIVIFDITQKMPSLNKTLAKKLIYSTKSHKITAFICDDSPILSYSKGLDAVAQGRYSQAVLLFEDAIKKGGVKFTMKKDCYLGAYFASVFNIDFNNALKYATLYGDIGFILNCKGQIALQNNNIDEAYNCYKQLETKLLNGAKSFYPLSGVYYMLGNFHAYPSSYSSHHSSALCAYYFKKGVAENDEFSVQSAYMLYYLWIAYQLDNSGGISDKDISYTEALSYLRKAAEKDYPPSYILLALAELLDVKDCEASAKWFEKAAATGNAKAMALYGKVLTTETVFSSRKQEGVRWLKKSLESDRLEKDIKDFDENIPRNIWPNSREDVERYLQKITASSKNNSYMQRIEDIFNRR